MVFFLKKVNQRIDSLNQRLANSFDRVRQDNENLYAWIQYLNGRSEENKQELIQKSEHIQAQESRIAIHQRLISQMREELDTVPKTREELKTLVDQVVSFEPFLDRIKRVEQRIGLLEAKSPSPVVRRQAPEPARPSALKERILRRISKNSKEYIKSVIMGIIRKYGKISALQLREMIVEEQGLCSKSSFYRILEELEMENVMHLVSRGKEKVYVPSSK